MSRYKIYIYNFQKNPSIYLINNQCTFFTIKKYLIIDITIPKKFFILNSFYKLAKKIQKAAKLEKKFKINVIYQTWNFITVSAPDIIKNLLIDDIEKNGIKTIKKLFNYTRPGGQLL